MRLKKKERPLQWIFRSVATVTATIVATMVKKNNMPKRGCIEPFIFCIYILVHLLVRVNVFTINRSGKHRVREMEIERGLWLISNIDIVDGFQSDIYNSTLSIVVYNVHKFDCNIFRIQCWESIYQYFIWIFFYNLFFCLFFYCLYEK